MNIEFKMPDSFIRVVDTSNYKGVPVTVLTILGQECLFFVGDASYMDNSDWEDMLKRKIAEMLGRMLLKDYAHLQENWQMENPTGRDIDNLDPTITFVPEEN